MISKHLCSLSLNATKKSRVLSGVNKLDTLLDAFGNSNTQTNPNASQFSRYVEYQYDKRCKMIGVKILDYLFEKSRVTSSLRHERNFHVFYYLIAGATAEEKEAWKISEHSSFKYLHRTNHMLSSSTVDAMRERFNELRSNMKSLGIGSRTQDLIFKTLMGVLYIGEIEFQDNVLDPGGPCQVHNRDALDLAADLLGVSSTGLEFALTVKTKPAKRDFCTVLLSAQGAGEQKNELARTVYSLLFRWIIEHINTRLCVEDYDARIGVVDFLGVDTSHPDEMNGFEAFLSNSANERVAMYINRTKGALLSDLINEGIVEYSANLFHVPSNSMKLIWSPDANSITSVLNEESRKLIGNIKSHEEQLERKLVDKCSSHLLYIPGKNKQFTIKHYCGKITYDIPGFIEKNRDMISADVISLFRGNGTDIQPSKNVFVRNLFSEVNVSISVSLRSNNVITSGYQSGLPQRRASTMLRSKGNVIQPSDENNPSESTAGAKRARRQSSVRERAPRLEGVPLKASDLATALAELEESLDKTSLWNIYCIATTQSFGTPIESRYVFEQLTSLDIPRTVAIARANGPLAHIFETSDFVRKYRFELGDLARVPDCGSIPEELFCDVISAALYRIGEHGIKCGPTKVFISDTLRASIDGLKKKKSQQDDRSSKSTSSAQGQYDPFLHQREITGQTADESLVSYGNQDLKRGQSPAFTADPSYVDDVSFDVAFQREDAIPLTGIKNGKAASEASDDLPPKDKMSKKRCQWLCCTWCLTWWIPSFVLSLCCKMKRPEIRIAWREKVSLCIIIFLMCATLLFFIIGFGKIICPNQQVISSFEISSKNTLGDPWVYTRGRAYQIADLIIGHEHSYQIQDFRFAGLLGTDVSALFFPGNLFTTYCPGLQAPQKGWDPLVNRPRADSTNYPHVGIDPKTGQQKLYLEYMNKYAKARVAWKADYIASIASTEKRLIIIHENVYDVSGYFNSQTKFFGPVVEQLFGNFYGKDATNQWNQIRQSDPNANLYMQCLNNMFYIGTVDHRNDFKCQFSNYILLATTVLLVAVVGFKFLAALQFGSTKEPENQDKFVICQIPCYTEDSESLSKTLESIASLKYDDRRKLIFIIADGMVVGSGNDRPTPELVLEILGIDPNVDPEPMSFQSVGEGDQQHNMGKVYTGLYEVQGHAVPYIFVVKVGKPEERMKPGNRGKRDSQLILMRFLSRVHFNAEMTPLELEIFHCLKNVIGVHPSFYEYVLMVDADTEVLPDSLTRLVSTMMHDSKIMGMCGETLLSNEKDSWITMIQVYEYFISHHLAKAFESLFGSVTCLPGCFCMYRIRSPTKNVPLLVSPGVINDYSENNVNTLHLKNLLHLGEDRYLTTLMMKHFPSLRLVFNPEAQCKTNAPDKWRVLLSQRRRWINSTVHNLVELLSLSDMCGVCCFSMRFVVFLDLFSTVVQPAGIAYLIYLAYVVATSPDSFPMISVIMLCAIYGFQVIIFMLKRQWAQIGWMVIYILAMPVFGFYIPLYSFWHFDDFSWGNTRMTQGEKAGAHGSNKFQVFDPKSIPMRRWQDNDDDKWESQSNRSGDSKGKTGNMSKIKRQPMYPVQNNIPPYGQPGQGYMQSAASVYAPSDYGSRQARNGAISPAGALRHPTPALMSRPPSEANNLSRRSPSEAEFISEIRSVLASVDLTITTRRNVREMVAQRLRIDSNVYKDRLNSCMDDVLKGNQ